MESEGRRKDLLMFEMKEKLLNFIDCFFVKLRISLGFGIYEVYDID